MSLLHVKSHTEPAQGKPPQFMVPLSVQLPMPSQVSGFVWMPPEHEPGTHMVPEAY